MNDDVFQVNAGSVDAGRIVAEIRESVKRKMEAGAYRGADVICAEQANMANLVKNEDFPRMYIDSLRSAVFIDINDFPIYEKRKYLGAPLRLFKILVWKILKFYTYRLWSQQNHVNGLMLTAIDGMEDKYSGKIKELETRLAALEKTHGEKNSG